MLANISQTCLGHNTNPEMGLKAQHLVSVSGLMKDMGEKWKVEGSLNISVPGGTYKAKFPQGCRMAVAPRRHKRKASVASRNETHHPKGLDSP